MGFAMEIILTPIIVRMIKDKIQPTPERLGCAITQHW